MTPSGDGPESADGPEPGEVDPDGEWRALIERLAAVIEVLEPGHYLVLVAPGNRFVQLAVEPELVRVETVSNQFLPPEHRLGFVALDQLLAQGWTAPSHFAPGEPVPATASPNHFMDLPADGRADQTAELVVSTLRSIHGVATPTDLAYKAGSLHGETILLPTLGVPRAQR